MTRFLRLFAAHGDCTDTALYLAGMAVVAGMLLAIGAMG